MCSIVDSALDPELVVTKLNIRDKDTKCKKCNSAEVSVTSANHSSVFIDIDQWQVRVVLRGKDVYCQQCLMISVQHKMRATLGKHKGII